MPKGVKGSGKQKDKRIIVEYETSNGSQKEIFIDKDILEIPEIIIKDSKEEMIRTILLLIVDALYDKDGDAATWKPIRDNIEAL